jgi:uncharacterized protein YejL (UPF0352 family)
MPSPVTLQETAAAVSQDTLMAQAMHAHSAQEAVSMMSVGQVVAEVENEQVAAGQLELIEQAKQAPYAPGSMFEQAAASPLGGSAGIPSFGGVKVAVTNRPKIEVLSEACESCSA